MGHFRCQCGHLISDRTSDSSYRARFFADGDFPASFEKHIAFCAGFVQAREMGKQNEFLARHFGEEYPKDLSVEDIIGDNVSGLLVAFGHEMFECEHCGRLHIQPILGDGELVSYKPETKTRGVLKPWKQ